MTERTECPDLSRLRALMNHQLSVAEQEWVVLHLNDCEHCQQVLERLTSEENAWAAGLRGLGEHNPELAPGLERVLKDFEPRIPAAETGPEATPPKGVSDFLGDFLAPPKQAEHLGRLGHYEVLEVIGRGGFGVVLKAYDDSLHRVVAIKVLASHLASNATARKRFAREAEAAAAVAHEHVVTIHAVEKDHEPPYIVMQYVSGASLQDRLDREGPLEVKEILRIGAQAARGLAAAHAQGVIHRDIKPANILLENGVERVKITDFGLARTLDDASLTQSGVIAGTPQYMAPEQANGEIVDHRADLFSLGSVLYALCTGRPPFRASTVMGVLKRVSEDDPRPIREVNPEIPDWLEAIVERLHAKHPADRFQSATELAERLEQHLAYLQRPGSTPRPRTEYVNRRRQTAHRGHPLFWIAALVVLSLSCCALPIGLMVSWFMAFDSPPAPAVAIESSGPAIRQPMADVVPLQRENPAFLSQPRVAVGWPPFVIIGREGQPNRPVANLADAIAMAGNGDVIEVQASGMFATSPIDIKNKALTIRAASGFTPGLQFTSDDNTDTPMLQTNAPLVLEGFEFKRLVQRQMNITVGGLDITEGPQPGRRLEQSNEIVRVDDAPLYVANCRFTVDFGYRCIRARNCPQITLRNCQFQGPVIYAVDWESAKDGRAIIENCILGTQVGLGFHCRKDLRDVSIELTHNTIVGAWPYVLLLDSLPDAAAAEPPLSMKSKENAILGSSGLLHFAQSDRFQAEERRLSNQQALAELPKLVRWAEDRNVYEVRTSYTNLTGIEHVRDWEKFWKMDRTGSLQGTLRFKLGPPVGPNLRPESFRLQTESLGQAASKDGRDLGADLDLVGPGDSYERWTKTDPVQGMAQGIGATG
jgi:serine/threonine-protein kinase